MTTDIGQALTQVDQANRDLQRIVRAAYPVGCEALYRRSPRVAAALVVVDSYGEGCRLHVHNRDTNNSYWVDGTNTRLERVWR